MIKTDGVEPPLLLNLFPAIGQIHRIILCRLWRKRNKSHRPSPSEAPFDPGEKGEPPPGRRPVRWGQFFHQDSWAASGGCGLGWCHAAPPAANADLSPTTPEKPSPAPPRGLPWAFSSAPVLARCFGGCAFRWCHAAPSAANADLSPTTPRTNIRAHGALLGLSSALRS